MIVPEPREPGSSTLRFVAIDEPRPGAASRAWIDAGRAHWQTWYERAIAGGYRAPSPEACRERLARAMPELLVGFDAACELVPDDPLAQVSIAEVDPPPMIPAGCTVRALAGPARVVRNYDFHPDATSTVVVRSAWAGREVLAMGEGIIGCLDGMNDAGLTGAITFGGRQVYGPGFGVLVILRWLLEVADDVASACRAVEGIPCAWSQNLLLADASGASAVVELAPDRPNRVFPGAAVTNHQGDDPAERSRTRLGAAQAVPGGEADAVEAFHALPIHGRSVADWMSTLYTAVYRIPERELELRWPGCPPWAHSLARFQPGEREAPIPGMPDAARPPRHVSG